MCKQGGTPLEERAIYSTDKTDFVGMTILRTKDAKSIAMPQEIDKEFYDNGYTPLRLGRIRFRLPFF